ncbi:branched-chain amino acid ABC transporter permease [Nonomuraea sp. NPDC050478]|uniref:branched-chain amino acid ABC transporter permease n=1 Tax=unclassified Nonomuraea TaxID=2593643 RepID=UPI0011CDE405|nr:branched-chain amino acid ABC transporter permease [Nonomuraea sp. C10]TXK40100.1 branched-chain amino acid ABC transporter permease [Nonomuraea sp. C10]
MEYVISLAMFAAVYIIVVTGYGLSAGLGKQFLISQAAMWGVGAYVYGILSLETDWPTAVCALLGVAGGVVASAVIALTALRVSGIYLAIVSFAFQIVFVTVLQNLEITGGQSGLAGIRGMSSIGPLTETESALLVAVAACAVVVLAYRVLHGSAFGLTVRALGEDPQVLEGLGVRPAVLKIKIICLSGGTAALGGVLYAQYLSYIDANAFSIHVSITLLSMLIVGGSRAVLGPAVGALFYQLIPQLLQYLEIQAAEAADLLQILFGLLLLLFLLFRPEGIVAPPAPALRAARTSRPPPSPPPGPGVDRDRVAAAEGRS